MNAIEYFFQSHPDLPFVEVKQHKILLEITPLSEVKFPEEMFFPFPKGVVSLRGADRVSFLQGLTTNDIASLAEGEGVRSLFTTNSGHILFDTMICSFADQLVIITDPGEEDKFIQFLQFYQIQEQVDIQDSSQEGYQILYCFTENQIMPGSFPQNEGLWYFPLIKGVFVLLADKKVDLVTWIKEKHATPIGLEAFELVRPIVGLSRAGVDFNKEYLPNEAGLEDAVSFTKGCFVGQEPIARIKNRGRPSKVLSQFLAHQPVTSGAGVFFSDEQVGIITSPSSIQTEKGFYALGYIKSSFKKKGTEGLSIGEVKAELL